jgi:hypothetical protein
VFDFLAFFVFDGVSAILFPPDGVLHIASHTKPRKTSKDSTAGSYLGNLPMAALFGVVHD